MSLFGWLLHPPVALNNAALTWRGQLPPKNYRNAKYSCKVFLGGLPWDTTEGEEGKPLFITPVCVKGHWVHVPAVNGNLLVYHDHVQYVDRS